MAAVVPMRDAFDDGRFVRRGVFRGGQSLARAQDGTPSGFAALDAALPWGGFPRGALTELLLAHDGIGEFELLRPALVALSAQGERIAFVAPPYIPYAPGLYRAGLPPACLTWVRPPPERAAWAAEQCLRAGCFGAVLAWSDGGDDRVLRRLQLAAADGGGHGFLFRPDRHAANASPAALRLRLEAASGTLRLRVLKCRGAVAPAAPLSRARAH